MYMEYTEPWPSMREALFLPSFKVPTLGKKFLKVARPSFVRPYHLPGCS